MNIVKFTVIAVVAIASAICLPSPATTVTTTSTETASDSPAISYLKEMEDYFNGDESVQQMIDNGFLSEYRVKREGNVLTVTYRYKSLLDFNLMSQEEKEQMASQSINMVKSVLTPEELDYHKNNLVRIKFVWIDIAGRFHTAQF